MDDRSADQQIHSRRNRSRPAEAAALALVVPLRLLGTQNGPDAACLVEAAFDRPLRNSLTRGTSFRWANIWHSTMEPRISHFELGRQNSAITDRWPHRQKSAPVEIESELHRLLSSARAPSKQGPYQQMATLSAQVLREHGALRTMECWLDEAGPEASSYHGETARRDEHRYGSFFEAAGVHDGETVVISWVEWPDKATRDKGMAKVTSDPRMQFDGQAPVFDGSRLIAGGFFPML